MWHKHASVLLLQRINFRQHHIIPVGKSRHVVHCLINCHVLSQIQFQKFTSTHMKRSGKSMCLLREPSTMFPGFTTDKIFLGASWFAGTHMWVLVTAGGCDAEIKSALEPVVVAMLQGLSWTSWRIAHWTQGIKRFLCWQPEHKINQSNFFSWLCSIGEWVKEGVLVHTSVLLRDSVLTCFVFYSRELIE